MPSGVCSPEGFYFAFMIIVSSRPQVYCGLRRDTVLPTQRAEAPDAQVLTTLKIARAVKSMAGKIVQDAAAKAAGGIEDRPDDGGCQDETGSPKTAVSSCCTGGSPH